MSKRLIAALVVALLVIAITATAAWAPIGGKRRGMNVVPVAAVIR